LITDPTNKRQLETMFDSFTARIDIYIYEEIMLTESGKAGYKKPAEFVPGKTYKIHDLGYGTGLELDEISKRLTQLSIVEIDLT
jgi:tRNA (cmo5U34)-methyltransferase